MRPIQKHLATASGRLETHLDVIEPAFTSAVSYARDHIGAQGIDVVFVDAPHDAIPEWGVGGATFSPFFILVSIDPLFSLERKNIESTLVHEFQEECIGEAPFYSRADITSNEVAAALLDLHAQPFNQRKWFFGTSDVTKHFGYTYGYQLCKSYAVAVKQSASELLAVSAREVLEHSHAAR